MTVTDLTVTPLAIDDAAADLLFREARTPRAFTNEPVTDDEMRAVYELVKFAPTALNAQPLRVTLVQSAEGRARLNRHMGEGNRERVATGPVVAVLTADRRFHEHLPTQFPHYAGARDMFEADETARTATARLSAGLQAGYFILGVRAVGLDIGPMTGMDAAGVEAELYPEGDREVLLVAVVGHADHAAGFPRGPRLAYEDVVETI